MSFVIDEAKLEELLKTTPQGYTATGSAIEPMIENHRPYYDNMGVSGTVFSARGHVTEEARERLGTIREKIVKSGKPLQSAAELTREIEGMRGRSR